MTNWLFHMIDDQYKLSDKSNTELHEWVAEHKPDSTEYVIGIQESMRRVAIIEELIERSEEPSRKRELMAAGISIISIAAAIFTIVVTYE